jgi:hypothetical protein
MQERDVFGKVAFAIIKEKKRISIIQVVAHSIGIGIFGKEVTRESEKA